MSRSRKTKIMDQSFTPITVLSPEIIAAREEQGLWIPANRDTRLEVVDCGDDRELTDLYYGLRTAGYGHEVFPARYFGAASGIGAAALIAIATEYGEEALNDFVEEFSPEGFVDFTTDLSDRAHKRLGTELNQHSAEGNEDNPLNLADHKHCDKGLGCAFAALLGKLIHGADGTWQFSEAMRVQSEVGATLPLREAADGLGILQRHIPEGFGIHRGALHHAQTRSGKFLPIAMHQGQHAPNDQASLVIDLDNYRSNANRHASSGLPRYHHTPELAVELLPTLMPEFKLNPDVLRAAGLLLGTSTRLALSGAQTPDALSIEVIPPQQMATAA